MAYEKKVEKVEVKKDPARDAELARRQQLKNAKSVVATVAVKVG